MQSAERVAEAYKKLFETVQILRSPNGCPWDKEQSPLSIREDLIEEAFETIDAISENNPLHAKEELGDVLLNATMISYMYEQENHFSVSDVLNELTEKLIRRHPHVFPESEGKSVANGTVSTGEEVLAQWDVIKEKLESRNSNGLTLDTVPKSFPPLLRAFKMQKKAAKKGFDWDNAKNAKEKLFEELSEVEDVLQHKALQTKTEAFTVNASLEQNSAQLCLEEEIGDAFFALVNYARHLAVNPVIALERANEKFYKRFSYVEEQCKKNGIPMDSAHLKEEDAFWNEAKQKGL